MTLAKALGGGLPVGAMLAKEAVARSFKPGAHASTFGGNPLACSVGLAVLKTILQGGVLKNCVQMGRLLASGLQDLKNRFSFIREVRGRGLIVGMELDHDGSEIVKDCLEAGLLINCTAQRVLRFLPPLTVEKKEIERGISILEKVLASR
jgi:acetylornithine/succinyldiaminopimelate/putrescine aminotransferase